jgi:hypothetical protein
MIFWVMAVVMAVAVAAAFVLGMLAERWRQRGEVWRRRPADAELTVDLSMRCECGRTVTVPAGFQLSTGFRERLGDLVLDQVRVVDSVTGEPRARGN